MLPGCVDLKASTSRYDLRVSQPARTPTVCVTNSDVEVLAYAHVYDMRVIECVDGDPTWYTNSPIGEPVLGDFRLG